MTRFLSPLFLLFPLMLSVPSLAQDEDLLGDDLDEDETADEKKEREDADKARLQEDDSVDDLLEDDEDAIDAVEEGDETTGDLLGEEIESDVIGGEGEDNSKLYRAAADRNSDMIPDEEMLAWEAYLAKYPNSLYRDRIDKRMDELEGELYEERIDLDEPERVDADKREMDFSEGIRLASINPRSRAIAGFEWGLPDYVNLVAGYEHQILRILSVHGQIQNAPNGFQLLFGSHVALVKSSRTQTLLSLLADFYVGFDPAFLGARPQIAFGKKFGRVDLQVQAGAEFEFRKNAAVSLIGGLNINVKANESVSLYVETNYRLKHITWKEGDIFAFNEAGFGMQFSPNLKGERPMQITVGANVPYYSNYWQFHFGSIMARVAYYL